MDATEVQRATAQLTIGGFFFACRLCKYLLVYQAEKRRTDILRMRCICFFHGGREIPHSHVDLERSECMSITFEMQKKDKKSDTINQLASGNTVMCPVRAWAAIVKRVRGYPRLNNDTPIFTVRSNGCMAHIMSKMFVNAIRSSCGSSWKRCNKYTSGGNRNSLNLIRSSDGNVFG